MRFQTAPTSACQRIPGLKDCEISFDQAAAGFAFPAAWLLEPISLHDLPRRAQAASSGLLDEDEADIVKLKRLLSEIIGVGGISPSFNLMASLCGTSSRTLHRHLQKAGLSYRKLLDGVRLERSRSLLGNSDRSVKEIAYELGYSGANNYIRAFRRMTGMTPEAFRSQQRGGGGAGAS